MPDRHHHHHHHYYDRDQHGYARNAGHPGPGPNPHRLYKDQHNKMISGVCAGIARYYGWDANVVRIFWAATFLLIGPLNVLAYCCAAMFMKKGPSYPVYENREEERFWRTFSTRPKATFSELKHRFRALDMRIADIESAVVSDEYGLRKQFRDLERGT
ncbi:MAG: envelope stress response membrane protein PspC [Marinicaulis sp.]|nr:envelope stress response membrane protein PspC [Marinicaulis sp.]